MLSPGYLKNHQHTVTVIFVSLSEFWNSNFFLLKSFKTKTWQNYKQLHAGCLSSVTQSLPCKHSLLCNFQPLATFTVSNIVQYQTTRQFNIWILRQWQWHSFRIVEWSLDQSLYYYVTMLQSLKISCVMVPRPSSSMLWSLKISCVMVPRPSSSML